MPLSNSKIQATNNPFLKVLFYTSPSWKIFWILSLFLCGGLIFFDLFYISLTGRDLFFGLNEEIKFDQTAWGFQGILLIIIVFLHLTGVACYFFQVIRVGFEGKMEEKRIININSLQINLEVAH